MTLLLSEIELKSTTLPAMIIDWLWLDKFLAVDKAQHHLSFNNTEPFSNSHFKSILIGVGNTISQVCVQNLIHESDTAEAVLLLRKNTFTVLQRECN